MSGTAPVDPPHTAGPVSAAAPPVASAPPIGGRSAAGTGAPAAPALAALLDAVGDGGALVDARGHVVHANAAAERLTGCARGGLLGRALPALYEERAAAAIREALARVHAGAAEAEVPAARARDGRAHALRFVATGGAETGVLLRAAPDGAAAAPAWPDRRLAGDQRFRALAEEAPVGVLLCDAAGLVVYANPQAGVIAGRLPRELLGTGLAEAIDGDDMPRVATEWRAFVAGGAPVLRVGYRVVRRSGELRTVQAQLRRLPPRGGSAAGFVAVLDDVTESLRGADAVRKAQRLEEVGQLAGGLAHEFNNLLTIIRGNLAFARGALPPLSAAHEDLAEVDRAAERAGTLVRQLLALARRQVLRLRPVDVRAVLRDATPRLRALCRPDVLLDVAASGEPAVVRADPAQLEQVLANLVANACEAMPGGGAVRVDAGPAALDDAAAREWGGLPAGAYVRLTVRDAGHGMDAASRARALEPFFTTKPHGTGMGLGLPVAHGIVAQSGGALRVESAPGEGTAVSVLLPRAAPDGAARPLEPVPGGSEAVLLAEASAALRAALARVLADGGYAVETAATAAEAVARARTGAYAVVVCAASLPDGDASAVAAAARAERPALPVVLVARGGEDDGAADGAVDGAVDEAAPSGDGATTWVLHAPLLGRELLATVRAALDGAGGR